MPGLYFRGRKAGYVVAALALVVVATLILRNIDFTGRRFPGLARLSRNRNLGTGTCLPAPLATSVLGPCSST